MVSKAVFKNIAFDTPMPRAVGRLASTLVICQHFQGWTLDYVQSLGRLRRVQILGFIEGQAKGRAQKQKTAQMVANAKRGRRQ